MKTLQTIAIAMLLLIIAVATPAATENASVLLQEGLYAEEIEGDLDAAIKIYEKIVAQAEQTQQAAAMAMYRIGMCRLKKGDKAQAASQFQQLIEKFPGQKAIVAKTQRQLAKIQPAPAIQPIPAGRFGPVIDSENRGQVYFYDFDKAKVFPRPEWLTRDSPATKVKPWGIKNGIDFIIDEKGHIESAEMIAVKVAYRLWDSAGPVEIRAALQKGPHETTTLNDSIGHEISAPITYVFKTREGGSGILQILDKKDNNVKIRYKMLRSDTSSPQLIRHFGPVIERVIHSEDSGKGFFYDLEAGKPVSPPSGLTRSSPPQEVMTWERKNGIDLVNDREWLGLMDMVAVEVSNRLWDSGAPAEISSMLKNASSKRMLVASPNTTYAFKTREGGSGILQILDITGKDSRFRYKMLQGAAPPASLKGNLYERLPNDVLTHVAGKYGSISAEAIAKGLFSNSHIYFVEADMTLRMGGMNYYRTSSAQPAGGRIHLSITSYPHQTLYDIAGRKMNTEIVPDGDTYHIYWTPSEPLPPGQMFYYGWSRDEARRLSRAAGTATYVLIMQNQFGPRCIETFFVVVPAGTAIIDKTEDYTTKETVGGFDIYHWTKEIPPNTDNRIDLAITPSATPNIQPANSEKTVSIFDSPQTATVYDIDHPKTKGKHCTIDLDTGLTGKLPVEQLEASSMDVMSYLADEGVDAVGEFAQNKASLIALGMVVEVMSAQAWDSLTPAELITRLSGRKAAATETKIMQWNDLGNQSVFAFATREGAMGLLQILSADEKAQRFELRYKKLKTRLVLTDVQSNTVQPSPSAAADLLPALKGLMGGVIEAIENGDSDTAVVLLEKLIVDSKKLAGFLKGTSSEAGVASGIGLLEMLREALVNNQMDRAKGMLSALNQMGPGLEDIVKKQAANQPKPPQGQTDLRQTDLK